MSPKLLDFFQILDSFRSLSELCIIVFVDRRASATLLASAIHTRELETTLSPQYVPDILLGRSEHSGEGIWHFFDNNTKCSVEERSTTKKQLEILSKFQRGDTNILISTSVGEEGLNIRKCKVVIRFDGVIR